MCSALVVAVATAQMATRVWDGDDTGYDTAAQMQPVGMLAGCRPCSSPGLPLLHAMQRPSLKRQGAKEVTVDNAAKPPGEGRWEAGGQSRAPDGGRLPVAAARS